MPAIKNTKSVQEFLPASFKLQQEKEAQAAENRKSFSDGPGLYLRAPKEGKNPKTGKPEPGSVEFRVMSECVFGFSCWYDKKTVAEQCKRWLAEDLIARGIEGGDIPADEIPETVERYRQEQEAKDHQSSWQWWSTTSQPAKKRAKKKMCSRSGIWIRPR